MSDKKVPMSMLIDEKLKEAIEAGAKRDGRTTAGFIKHTMAKAVGFKK